MLKDAVQNLITQGVLQFDRVVVETKVGKYEVDVITIHVKAKTTQVPVTILVPTRKPPITITMPGPIPYDRRKKFLDIMVVNVINKGRSLLLRSLKGVSLKKRSLIFMTSFPAAVIFSLRQNSLKVAQASQLKPEASRQWSIVINRCKIPLFLLWMLKWIRM